MQSVDRENTSNQNVENSDSEVFKCRFEKLKKWYQERDLMTPDDASREELIKTYGKLALESGVEDLGDESFEYYVKKEQEIVEEQVKRGMGIPASFQVEKVNGYRIPRPTISGYIHTEAQVLFQQSIRQDTPVDELRRLAELAKVDFDKFVSKGKWTEEIKEISEDIDIVDSSTGEVEHVPAGRLYIDPDRSKYFQFIAVVPKAPNYFNFHRDVAGENYRGIEVRDELYENYKRLEHQPLEKCDLDAEPQLAASVNFPSRLRFD